MCSPDCRLQPYVSRFMAKPLHVNIVENLWQHVLKKDPQWFEKQAGAPRSTPTPTTPPPTPRSPAHPAHPRFASAAGRLERSWLTRVRHCCRADARGLERGGQERERKSHGIGDAHGGGSGRLQAAIAV